MTETVLNILLIIIQQNVKIFVSGSFIILHQLGVDKVLRNYILGKVLLMDQFLLNK